MGTALQRTIHQLRSEDREFFQIAISVDCVIFGFDKKRTEGITYQIRPGRV